MGCEGSDIEYVIIEDEQGLFCFLGVLFHLLKAFEFYVDRLLLHLFILIRISTFCHETLILPRN